MISPQLCASMNFILRGCLVLLATSSFAAAKYFGTAHDGGMTQWTNCTPTDAVPRHVSIGVAMTSKMLDRFGNNQAEAKQWVQSVLDDTNFIYMNQLNVRLVAGEVFFAPSDGIAWNNPKCSMVMDDQLAKFSEWKPPSEQGLWHLFDDCLKGSEETTGSFFEETKSGMAFMSGLCHMGPGVNGKYANVGISSFFEVPFLGDITYRVFAHEVGHNFGAIHPYGEDIVLKDGGIMSYGTGHYDCDLGFVPQNKDKICAVLTWAEESQCAALSVPTTPDGLGPLSRAQFMETRPAEPKSVDSNVYKCGARGYSFAEVVCMSVFASCLGCCVILCLAYAVSRICRIFCGYDDDEYEESELEASDVDADGLTAEQKLQGSE